MMSRIKKKTRFQTMSESIWWLSRLLAESNRTPIWQTCTIQKSFTKAGAVNPGFFERRRGGGELSVDLTSYGGSRVCYTLNCEDVGCEIKAFRLHFRYFQLLIGEGVGGFAIPSTLPLDPPLQRLGNIKLYLSTHPLARLIWCWSYNLVIS